MIFPTKKIFLLLVFLIVYSATSTANTQSLAGPDLTIDVSGFANSGLQITAIENVTIDSFIFENLGLSDTIFLKNSNGNVLQTYDYLGGDPFNPIPHLVEVSWGLEAGQTYFLVSQKQSNSKYTFYSLFPEVNDHIQVDGTHFENGQLKTNFWFKFTDIITSNDSGENFFNPVNGLGIRAEIDTVEKGIVEAIWLKGGEADTARGDKVIWGHFYANPTDVSWGSVNNPDLFVKIWFDVSGRIDVNYFHVSVPDIHVFTALSSASVSPDESGITDLDTRYIRHSFDLNGFSSSEENFEDGISPPNAIFTPDPVGNDIINNIHIGTRVNTVGAGLIEGVWQPGGQSSTARGDEVVWGHYSADPSLVSWGNPNNPEIFVKIWFDVSGRIDVNYFHVSVPDIGVYSAYFNDIDYDLRGVTILDDRYTRHEFNQ